MKPASVIKMQPPGQQDRSARSSTPAVQLKLEGLVKEYGRKRVVDRVSLSVGSGEIVGLLGPNGAGKTTTFYMTVGLIRPDQGHVFLNDRDITRTPMYLSLIHI